MSSTSSEKKGENGFSLVCLKYSLCLYNFIFLLSGCVVCGLGLWTVLDKWEMVTIIPSPVYQVTIWMVISTGCVSVLVALLGYTAAAFESRCLLAWYTIFLVMIFIIESIIGLLAYVYQDKLELDLKEHLRESLIYPYDLDTRSTSAIDSIQEKYHCCGAESYQDWRTSGWQTQHVGVAAPDSCCKSPSPGCGVRDHPSNIHYTGCRHRFFDEVSEHLVYVSCISVCIAVLQICGIILTSSLFSTLHKLDKYSLYTEMNSKKWSRD